MLSAGIVILNYNTGKVVKKFVEKIRNYNLLKKIIIVDNCSTDESLEVLSPLADKKVEIIVSDKNGGYASGNNIGLRRLAYYDMDIAIVANPDVEFNEDVVEELLLCFEKYKEYGVLSCVHLDTNEGFSERQCWKIPSLRDELLDCFFFTRPILKKQDIKRFVGKQPPIIDVEVIPGCFYGVRMDVLKHINYLDEGTFLYYEENILGFNIRKMGLKEGIISYKTYIHRHENSSTVNLRKSINAYKVLVQSKMYYQYKYLKVGGIKRWIMKLVYKYAIIEKYFIYKIRYR